MSENTLWEENLVWESFNVLNSMKGFWILLGNEKRLQADEHVYIFQDRIFQSVLSSLFLQHLIPGILFFVLKTKDLDV